MEVKESEPSSPAGWAREEPPLPHKVHATAVPPALHCTGKQHDNGFGNSQRGGGGREREKLEFVMHITE